MGFSLGVTGHSIGMKCNQSGPWLQPKLGEKLDWTGPQSSTYKLETQWWSPGKQSKSCGFGTGHKLVKIYAFKVEYLGNF